MGDVNPFDFKVAELNPVPRLDRVKVSLRGKGEVDVNKIAATFGGGGHANAAGCTVSGSLDAVTRRVLDAVGAALAAPR